MNGLETKRGTSPTVREGSPLAEALSHARANAPIDAEARKPGERNEESYVIDAGLKLLRLLECVEGKNFEPVTIKRFMQRTGFNRDLTRRLIITAKKGRWLKELVSTKERQFVPGPKLENLGRNLMTSMLARNAAER